MLPDERREIEEAQETADRAEEKADEALERLDELTGHAEPDTDQDHDGAPDARGYHPHPETEEGEDDDGAEA